MTGFLYLPNWEVSKVLHERKTLIAQAVYLPQPEACPKCNAKDSLYKHGVKETDYADAPVRGHQSVIRADRRRYRCRICSATSLQPLPDIDDQRRMTKRCVEYIQEQGLLKPFTQVAADVGVDEKTVRTLAGEHIKVLNDMHIPMAPEVLGIDEVTILKKPRAIFTDIGERRCIDLMENRAKPSVAGWLSRLPNKDRINVVAIDMWPAYRDAVRAVLPNAAVVVDKFHIVRMASQGLETVRKRVGRDLGTKGRRMMMRSRFILLRRHKDLSAEDRFKLDGWLKNVPDLDAAYKAKEAFYDIWDCRTKQEATLAFYAWRDGMDDALKVPFKPLRTSMENWHREIFAYWDYPVTNAFTEATNGILKIANRLGRGYSFPIIRARMLYKAREIAEDLFQCGSCLGDYPKSIAVKSRRFPGKTLCPNCHRFHTLRWFKHNAVST